MDKLVDDIISTGGINNEKYLKTIQNILNIEEDEIKREIEVKIEKLKKIKLTRIKYNIWYDEEIKYY